MQTHPAHLGNFVKASKGGGSPQNAATAGPSSTTMLTPPKNRGKEKEEEEVNNSQVHCHQWDCTCTREEKESDFGVPDSEAEGPFRDSDRTESASENSPNTNQ